MSENVLSTAAVLPDRQRTWEHARPIAQPVTAANVIAAALQCATSNQSMPYPLSNNMRCTPPQLYNEDINDLLAPDNLKLPIHESKEAGVYVAGLREDIVVSVEQVMQLLSEGEANRHIGATKMNEGSSRSHTVFRMVSCQLPGRSSCFTSLLTMPTPCCTLAHAG